VIKISNKTSNQKLLIAIGGPTAIGKTALSLKLASQFKCPIISTDSRQFYKEISIGTAKPNASILRSIKHYFIDSLSIHESYSVGDFEKDALEILEDIFKTNSYAIACGGNGLYFRAITKGLDSFPTVPESLRNQVAEELQEYGIENLQQELKDFDPTYFSEVDQHNPHRLIRAIAVIRYTGKPFSSFRTGHNRERSFKVVRIALSMDRASLYARINQRVDQMVEDGLFEEAQKYYALRHLNSLNTVGYQEIFDYIDELYTKDEAIEKVKQHTRNYAKRQMTWFRNQPGWLHFHPDDISSIVDFIHRSAES
jgi:tRNA dimethylallyltransferase